MNSFDTHHFKRTTISILKHCLNVTWTALYYLEYFLLTSNWYFRRIKWRKLFEYYSFRKQHKTSVCMRIVLDEWMNDTQIETSIWSTEFCFSDDIINTENQLFGIVNETKDMHSAVFAKETQYTLLRESTSFRSHSSTVCECVRFVRSMTFVKILVCHLTVAVFNLTVAVVYDVWNLGYRKIECGLRKRKRK